MKPSSSQERNERTATNENQNNEELDTNTPPPDVAKLWNSTARAINHNMREIRSQLRLNNQMIEQMKAGMLKTLSFIKESYERQISINSNSSSRSSIRTPDSYANYGPTKSAMKSNNRNGFKRPLSVNMSNFELGSIRPSSNNHRTNNRYNGGMPQKRMRYSNSHNFLDESMMNNEVSFNNRNRNPINFDTNEELEGESTVVSDSEDDPDNVNIFN